MLKKINQTRRRKLPNMKENILLRGLLCQNIVTALRSLGMQEIDTIQFIITSLTLDIKSHNQYIWTSHYTAEEGWICIFQWQVQIWMDWEYKKFMFFFFWTKKEIYVEFMDVFFWAIVQVLISKKSVVQLADPVRPNKRS